MFLNGSKRSEKGLRDLDRIVLALRGDGLPIHRWDELKMSLGDSYAIVDAWLAAMESEKYISTIDGKKTGVTWEERLIVHAARSLSCPPAEVFDRINAHKKRLGVGIIFSAEIGKTATCSPVHQESQSSAEVA